MAYGTFCRFGFKLSLCCLLALCLCPSPSLFPCLLNRGKDAFFTQPLPSIVENYMRCL